MDKSFEREQMMLEMLYEKNSIIEQVVKQLEEANKKLDEVNQVKEEPENKRNTITKGD